MPEEYNPQQPSISESLTDGEYIKVRELGGQAIGEILEQSPYLQVEAFCDIARHEHELHGDQEFIKKNLDLALERALKIGSGNYIPGAPESRSQSAYGYLQIAEAAIDTDQDKDYTLAAIDAATEEIKRKNLGWIDVKKVADVAHSVEPSSQRVHDILRLAIKPHWMWMKGGDSYRTKVYGFDDVLAYATLCELGDESAEALIDDVRQKNRSVEEEPEKRVSNLIHLSEVIHEHIQRPKVDSEALQPLIPAVLEEARTEALTIEETSAKVKALADIAEASHKVGLSDVYGKELVEEGLTIALADTQQNPRTTIDQIHRLLATSMELEQFEYNDEYLTGPALDFIRGLEISAREKHQLLNQLVGGWNIPEDFMRENNIAKKPLSFIFTD